jgi:AraC-like DNA-binding protein
LDPVKFDGMKLGLLGRVESTRGVQILATHGMPNGRVENHITTDATRLTYTSHMPADAIVSRGRLPFRFVGALGLLATGHSYTLRASTPFTCAHCIFRPDFLADLSDAENGLRIGELNIVTPIESEGLTYMGEAMLREAIEPGFGASLFAEAIGMAVAVEIARWDGGCKSDEAPRSGGLPPWQMRRLEYYIRDHLSDEITLRDLALLLDVSVHYLSRAIKLTQGVGIHRWVAGRRVAEARRLLVETDASIGEVARRCAFLNASAFTRAFRAASGLTPLEFRQLIAERW